MRTGLRAPTTREMEIFRWLLVHGRPEVLAFLPQLEGIRVSAYCECCCPSLTLSVRAEYPPIPFAKQIIVQAVSEMESSCVGLMLWTEDGKLADFEVWEAGIDERPYGLPDPETLRITE